MGFGVRSHRCISTRQFSAKKLRSTTMSSALPPDDPQRNLAVARPDDDSALPHVGVVGDTYTILLSGKDTGGRYCLIDMHVPPGGGPPPHRHDFEESFTILEGEIEVTFRGKQSVLRTGETAHSSGIQQFEVRRR
jgi:mannose-6-phosphate isomerase-like protein (cupin superfamily)